MSLPSKPNRPVYEGLSFFNISAKPLIGKYELVVDLGTLTGYQNIGLAIVDRKTDGKRFIRKHTDWNDNGVIRLARLKLMQRLNHPNIVRFVDASWDEESTHAELFMEICDLGDLHDLIFADKKKPFGVGDDTDLPSGFVWHLLLQITQAMCYMAYGYPTLEMVLSTKGIKPGWEPLLHGDMTAKNIFLKSSGVGRYPTLVLGDLDHIEGKWEVNDDDDFRQKQNMDYRHVVSIMMSLHLRMAQVHQPLMLKLLCGCLNSSLIDSSRSPTKNPDFREMARTVVEAYEDAGITYEPLSQPMKRPLDDMISEAERGGMIGVASNGEWLNKSNKVDPSRIQNKHELDKKKRRYSDHVFVFEQ